MFAQFREGLVAAAMTDRQFDDLLAWWQVARNRSEGLSAFLVRHGILTPADSIVFEKSLQGKVPVQVGAALLASAAEAGWPKVPAYRALAPGDQFSHYRIIDQLGRGPRATVYKAEDTRTQHTVALKLFNRPGSRAGDASVVEPLMPPADFGHPNCLRPLESGSVGGVAYVAMPYAEAGSAYQVLAARGSMPPAQAARICRLAAQGLAAAHAAGIPHGNLKLSNILLGQDHQVWLSDFGSPQLGDITPAAAFTADLEAFAVIIAQLVTSQSIPDIPIAGSLPRLVGGVPAPFGEVVAALVAGPPAAPCASAAQLAGVLAAAEATVVATTTATLAGPVPPPPGTDPTPTPVIAQAPVRATSGPAAAIGRTLGKCLLTAQIGQGGAGVVYRAEHLMLNIDVAVKVLHADSADPIVRKGLRREARLLARLNHPNVVRLWDFDESSVPPYLVMELVDGATLADLITLEGAMPAARALALVEQVAHALSAAHQLGIVHRDVKPANVLVTPDGRAKLTDLGLALMINGRLSSLARPHVTGLAGTIAYLAPEQAVASPTADHRADIYSLGATFYHLVTGRVPFPALTVMDVLRKHATEPPPPPHEIAPQVPSSISPTILKMLAKDPNKRQPTYEALLSEFQALHDALESARLRTKTEPVIELVDEPRAPQAVDEAPRPSSWWDRLLSLFRGSSRG